MVESETNRICSLSCKIGFPRTTSAEAPLDTGMVLNTSTLELEGIPLFPPSHITSFQSGETAQETGN